MRLAFTAIGCASTSARFTAARKASTRRPTAVATQNGNRLCLHFLNWPFSEVHLPNLAGRIEYAQLLHDGSEVLFKESGHFAGDPRDVRTPEGAVTLSLPIVQPDVVVPVVELFLK